MVRKGNLSNEVDKREPVFDKNDPLAVIEFETPKANRALFDYAHMGISRSLWKLIDKYKKQDDEWKRFEADPKHWPKDTPIPLPIPSKTWTTISGWSGVFFWQERVMRFDEIEMELESKEYLADRIRWARRRKELATGFFNKTVAALNALNINKQEMRDVTNAVKAALDEIRNEFGDDPEVKPKNRIKLVEVVLSQSVRGIDVKVLNNGEPETDSDD